MTYNTATNSFSQAPARPSIWKRYRFVFRICMMALPLGFFVLTRTNPDLHMSMVMKGTEIVSGFMDTEGADENTTMAKRFADKVKVNRFGSSGGGNAFGGGNAQTNAKSQAADLGKALSNMKVGG